MACVSCIKNKEHPIRRPMTNTEVTMYIVCTLANKVNKSNACF